MSVAALAGLYMMLIAGIAFAAIIAICEFTWRKRKLAVDENVSSNIFFKYRLKYFLLQTSIWLEMLEALKFAINPFAGDTKANPLACESKANSRASSKAMLTKSQADSLNKYGQIGSELSLAKTPKDPTYERFNDHS